MKTKLFLAAAMLLMGAATVSAQNTIDRGSQKAEKQAKSGQTAAAGKTASQATQSGRYSGGSTPGLADKVRSGCDRARENAEKNSGTSGNPGSGTSNSNGTSNGSAEKNNTTAKNN